MKLRDVLMACVAIAFGAVVQASPVTVLDQYWGAIDPNNYYGDRIGSDRFEVSHAVIALDGTKLTIDIYTNFVNFPTELGARYGDLFLNHEWTPYATATDPAPAYRADKYDTGTQWGWALSLAGLGTGTETSGALTLYELATANAGALLSQDFFGSGYHFRKDQEVRVNTAHTQNRDTGMQGNWSVTRNGAGGGDDFLRFEVDLAGTSLARAVVGSGTLAFHWGQTCGNDVIEGAVELGLPPQQIPEPTAMALVGLGLGLLGVRLRRRRA